MHGDDLSLTVVDAPLPGDIAVVVLPDLSAACLNAALPPRARNRIAAFLAAHLPPTTDAPTSGAEHPGA